jgi:CelD/BcsL family acetyltransferase involved in cellulose biosynthesis
MIKLNWRKLPANALLTDASLQTEWDRLSAQRLDLPFMCASAIGAALALFGTGQEQLLVGSHDAGVQAMLILVPDGRLRWRTFQPSQMPLGAWVAMADVQLPTLCHSLMHGPLGLCLVVSITQVDPLQAPRLPDTAHTRHSDYIDTAWVDVTGSFGDYWSARGKNLRQNMRKQRNKLAAEGTAIRMQILRAVDEIAPALARYGALESAGWKASQGTAIHTDNEQGLFYKQLFEAAAGRGEAVFFEYLFNDKTAAINLCLMRAGVLVVLKTTYDESIPKALSPAFLLREEELQHIFAGQEIRRIEYYGKVMDWHTKFTEKKRGLYHLTTYRWPLLKRLARRGQPISDVGLLELGAVPDHPAAESPLGAHRNEH